MTARRPFSFTVATQGGFGGRLRWNEAVPTGARVEALCGEPERLAFALQRFRGLLVLSGLEEISADCRRLLALSRCFGPETEDYRQTLAPVSAVHPDAPEIFVVSNAPPVLRMPPPLPDPPRSGSGGLPVRFPHRRGWHTDQSYRRPPPDISLFYAVVPAPPGEGQTLYADGIAAYASLPPEMQARIEDLQGLHVKPGSGRSESAVRSGETPAPLAAHERPQPQPVVRTHPETGERALYLCEAGQMDWSEGPFIGLEPGPDREGARLLYALMARYTRPEHVYVQEWEAGDLVIYDNRNTVHAATWYDAEHHERVMWRTTVRGNPGPEYEGERSSWLE